MPDRITLHPNEPITVSLVDPFADSSELYDQERAMGEYRTTDGRVLCLPRQACVRINELNLSPGEEIGVCYRGKEGFSIWPKSQELKPAETPEEPTCAEPAYRQSRADPRVRTFSGETVRRGHWDAWARAETLSSRRARYEGSVRRGPATHH